METMRKRYICVAFVVCSMLAVQISAGAGLVMDTEEISGEQTVLQIFSITTVKISSLQDLFNRHDCSSEQCSALHFAMSLFRQVNEHSLLSSQTDIYLGINSVATPRFEFELPSDVVSPDLIIAAN